ncbi:amino acid/amide ABC transporter substrate-binding protein, HAAT family [Micromonospora rhizosphaerae]|uniref:Amino acid/amide ABC transporter substrate-binding protein, HAAT family n=1 Tax=Micromonospora rhizosphaerae TaxID=568872 RepID=A0A1C6T122_9ACTN|nr:branched-chain amino acid ABC transporter substrate-binding protein [Micromonospora rhizosphaerae]SCL35510.1 amino acid/amide ABC transporter substrate-binding protein, HAAT family [Micromonospora rhizosphaerae]
MARHVNVLTGLVVVAMAAGACGGDPGGTGTSTGEAKNVVVGVDLPFQGASKDASDATWNAMQLYLEQQGGKAGKHTVTLKKYDDSTAAKGAWDDATCAKNAQDHVANANEVAVMGTYNSGCAKIEAPVLNADSTGPLLMISHANTNPGLTKKWDPGEPEKFFPSGKRNYGRVITTDDYQGAAAAQFVAKDLQLKKCYVLNDNETYGQGVAKTFADEAKKQGIEVVGEQAWDKAQPNYVALFQQVKSKNPDCVYFGGIYDNNGGQLVKDKVKVLGPNSGPVKLLGPDGFTGYTDLQKLAEGQGMYLTFAGLDTAQLRAAGGAAATFLDAYKAKYGSDPVTSYAMYGVMALQVILAAIEKSDGTRKGVRDAVFEGSGISIPASKAVLGKDLAIDPKSGDASARDISVLIMKGNKETFHKAWPVTS